MARPIDWLLSHLDLPDVTEIVLGLGRPAAVKGTGGYRAITSMDFERKDIEILVAGTPLTNLIGAPTSLPPAELDIDGRMIVVEVIRQGPESALRLFLPAGAQRRDLAEPPRTFSRIMPARTQTPSTPPLTAEEVGVRFKPPSSPPETVAPRTRTPSVAPAAPRTPTDEAVAPSVARARTTSAHPPAPVARTVSRTLQPQFGVPDAPVVYEPDFVMSEPVRAPLVAEAPADLPVPPAPDGELRFDMPTGYGEIEEVLEEPLAVEDVAALAGDAWHGPQIIDEHTDIRALHSLLEAARRRGASDLHVIAGRPITIRRLGELVALDADALVPPYDSSVLQALFGPLDPRMAERFVLPLLGPSARAKLEELGYVDLGFSVPGRGRVRGNISRQQDGLSGAFRLARETVPTLDELGLPRELAKVVRHHQGLVVIAGPSGHGKTTTMAALVNLLNNTNSDHIITIEDPVEIEHPAKRAIVSHREVKRHTLSFVAALKASLREDPDVIVIGELRDRETVEIALTAAETGHLVLATISTPSAVKTIDRLIDMFPPDDQVQVRASISGTLRAVIAQRLLPNAAGNGMVAAIELVTGVLPLAAMIRDNKLFQLPSLMQRGRAFGMIRLDDSLAEHVRAKRITEVVAMGAAENKRDLAAALSPRAAASAPTMTHGLFGPRGGKP
ncbi:MAG: PilT/PilU family type 4a pilus ATPase [Myxococcales bacterium]|nr:PilT/PilU family type 4a pilus ATPase [Myxococcales bacterium]